MALTPMNETHKKQIEAGRKGRNKGHKFEFILSSEINNLQNKNFSPSNNPSHLYNGNPAKLLLQYISNALLPAENLSVIVEDDNKNEADFAF